MAQALQPPAAQPEVQEVPHVPAVPPAPMPALTAQEPSARQAFASSEAPLSFNEYPGHDKQQVTEQDDEQMAEQVTEAQVLEWCAQNNRTLIASQSLEMDVRRRIASRTQYLPMHKSVADQFVSANFSNTPLEFCRFISHTSPMSHACSMLSTASAVTKE